MSVWEEFRPTALAVSEYLVIGLAGKISPKHLLNRHGIPRQLSEWTLGQSQELPSLNPLTHGP